MKRSDVLESTETRDGYPHAAVNALPARCRSVLMVGTDPGGKGGIGTVVRGLLDAGLFERFAVTYVATHRHGNRWAKTRAALGGWLEVASLLRSLDAPLVHVQTASRASFWRKSVVCLLARLAGRPYLLHVHGGGFLQFYETESGPLARRCIRSILANAALVIAVSDQWRERLLRICPAATVEVVTNAVALPDGPALQRVQTRDPKLLYLGDLSESKGTYDLVRAFAAVADRFPTLELVCGGTGRRDEVRKLASALKAQDRVSCPGWLDPVSKREALAAAAIFALPSYAEGMPTALLEAMSWGLPVIASSVGGIPQLITHGANGLLIEPGDVEGLAAAISRLMNDRSLRDRLGAAARATIEAGFTLDRTLARLSHIYRRFGIEPGGAGPQ